jgi:hypothetical protein
MARKGELNMIGKITRVPLREVWKHEALDFTTWIEENIDVINDILNLNLANPERERAAGRFSVDLVAEDDKGNPVIIENQLEKSNHDHLGKIITYLTAIEAKTAIWIVADPRPEHIKAIAWLNESSSTSFFLLKVEAIKIEESAPAPLLTLIVGPSEEARDVGKTKKDLAERFAIRYRWWTQLLEHVKTKTKLHANISPNEYSWLGTSAGKSGIGFNYTVTKTDSVVELYIDRGKGLDEENKSIFNQLYKSKEKIESAFGGSLEWQSLEGKRACRIKKQIKGGYRDPGEKWPEIHKKMVDTMTKFHEILKPHIQKLRM